MKTLPNVIPTPEQATVIDNDSPGFWLIRGAAGSGKTTTALLRLKFLVRYWRDRRVDLGLVGPVRVLVMTFNRTLRGYIAELARQQIQAGPEVALEVTTFGSWAQNLVGRVVLDRDSRDAKIRQLAGSDLPWLSRFVSDEVDYVLGRFPPDKLDQYLTLERTGRGGSPTLQRPAKERLLDQVVHPYTEWKRVQGVVDWTDLSCYLADNEMARPYDVVIVDETQDFSANQIRAVVNHLAGEFVCTFIRDTTQRIYPYFFTWSEVGVAIPSARSRHLGTNYRNTRQIAAFARPLVEGIERVEDESFPDFTSCLHDGPKPVVIRGRYGLQAAWAIRYLDDNVAEDETVAFLHPRGGGWFSELRRQLAEGAIPWVSLTRESEWPGGDERVALSTMHSAKGLEFDHVIILGYDAETVQHGEEPDDVLVELHRRLLAMAVGRSRKGVVVGYRPEVRSPVIDLLDEDAYEAVDL